MKKTVFFAIFIALSITTLTAETYEPTYYKLSVEDAVSMAINNNVSIKQSKIALDLLEKQDKYSWNSISPSLSLSGGVNGGGNNVNPTGDLKDNGLSWSATGSLNLNFTPALFTAIKSAKMAYESGEISLENAKRAIELNVRKSFYSLLSAKNNISLQEASVESVKNIYESNKIKYNSGRLSELDLLTSQYNYESKKPSLEIQKNNYKNTLNTFKQLLGLKLIDDVELEGNLEEVLNLNISDEVINVDVETLPAVQTVKRNIETVKNALTATKVSAWGPSLSVGGSVSANNKFEKNAGDPKVSYSYQVNVRIPLDGYLPWSNGSLSIESQKVNLEKLEIELENTKTSTIISLQNYYNAIVQAQNQLKTLENNLDLMQRTYNMTSASYNSGKTSLISLQSAADNLSSAKYNLQAQRYSIISAVLDLENILGLPFGSLNTD